ncbi:hypothetical protein ACOZ4B_08880 [Haloferax prahovense]|uniref:hypothetical protein n=1 Tax=Haloferax prahovense TaxID=381852 RepID=UPI003C7617C7
MPLATQPAVARTYATPVDDPWEYVLQYRETMDYVAANPDKGSTAVGTAVGLPRSRVREWMNGRIPDVVRGLTTAVENGWFPETFQSEHARALNILVAAVFATGSISTESYSPSFVVDDETADQLEQALTVLGTGVRMSHETDTKRTTELRPRRDAVVLGRVLAAAGAPTGAKVRVKDLSLPSYLSDAPMPVKREFAEVYVRSRGTRFESKDTTPLIEQRSNTFRRELAAFLSSLTDEAVSVGTTGVFLSAAAARRLGVR